ncbi:MAG: tRNA (cytidine(34)-2'-O)-methyltransferase [Deltaproteobacteria bacterium]|nr:MAG: tRNA (cytidine(34)-2'-O)-methyltransferase [Deltaproteobacteria bacterium]
MHVVLVNPLIPQNTGNISRLCAGVDAHLHLVGKLGFSLDDRYLKRAGLDYWPHVKLHLHASFEAMVAEHAPERLAFFTSHATKPYTDFAAGDDPWFVFGMETTGLPAEIREAYPDDLYKIPITKNIRSLNLSNSVAIVVYDALRQQGFPGLG